MPIHKINKSTHKLWKERCIASRILGEAACLYEVQGYYRGACALRTAPGPMVTRGRGREHTELCWHQQVQRQKPSLWGMLPNERSPMIKNSRKYQPKPRRSWMRGNSNWGPKIHSISGHSASCFRHTDKRDRKLYPCEKWQVIVQAITHARYNFIVDVYFLYSFWENWWHTKT